MNNKKDFNDLVFNAHAHSTRQPATTSALDPREPPIKPQESQEPQESQGSQKPQETQESWNIYSA